MAIEKDQQMSMRLRGSDVAQGAHIHRTFLIHSLRANSARVRAGILSIKVCIYKCV